MKLPRFIRKAIFGHVNGITMGDVVCDAWLDRAGDAEVGDVVGLAYDYSGPLPKLRTVVQWRKDGRFAPARTRLALVTGDRVGSHTVDRRVGMSMVHA